MITLNVIVTTENGNVTVKCGKKEQLDATDVESTVAELIQHGIQGTTKTIAAVVSGESGGEKSGAGPIKNSENHPEPTLFPWRPIETIPATGDFLLAIATDDGWTYSVLPRDKKGNFIHEGEPTFCHGYYFEPRFWAECPPPPTEEQIAATEDASDS